MTTSRLLVYNASAGSGKTFQIAKRYLKQLIQAQSPFYISRLIGITFTNKAAEEMKKRIIENLIQAAQDNISDVMAAVSAESEAVIKQQTGIVDAEAYRQEIVKRSQARLTEILHYYDEFQLTTIDKLMYKLIKTFAREMHLSGEVNVIMEYKEVVDQLIDKLINRAEKGSLLSKFLIGFALQKTDEEKHWDVKRDLSAISQIIFDDNYFEELKSIENKTLQDFVGLRKYLSAEIKKLESQMEDFARELQAVWQPYKEVFKVTTLTRQLYFEKKKVAINKTLRKQYEATAPVYYTKTKLAGLDTETQVHIKEILNEQIHQIMLRLVPFVEEQLEHYRFLKALLGEVNALSIENELQKDIALYKEEQGSIFISDFNKLILEQILKDLASDTPYIYMRLGEKYAHYFVDEFQDTSILQWQNLIPLIREALSKEFDGGQKGDAMLVGDAKQSIYRFRGGKPEQFIALSNPDLQDGEGNPFAPLVQKKVSQLEYNWRSKTNIVKFNNLFFSSFSKELPGVYRPVYENVVQKIPPGRDTGEGFVQIRFMERGSKTKDSEIEKEDYAVAVYEMIQQAEKNGFQKEEICILVNRNKEGIHIAEYLNAQGIPVISSESLLVANAGKVKFLIAWLQFIQTGLPVYLYDAVHFLAARDGLETATLYEEILTGAVSPEERVREIQALGYDLDYQQLINLSLYDLLVYLIDVFRLHDNHEQAYLQMFMEKVYQLNNQNAIGLQEFLLQWEDLSEKLSIDVPEKKGAVKIMTVHKSKGLEFPVVIYYTNEDVLSSRDKANKVWVPLNPAQYQGFEILPVPLGVLENSTNEVYRQLYTQAAGEKIFDNLNRVYVAMTRAVSQLYVVLYKPGKNPNNRGINQVFAEFIGQNFPEASLENFTYGNPKRLEEAKSTKSDAVLLDQLTYQSWQARQDRDFLKINTVSYERWAAYKKAAIQYGLQLHEILSHITTAQDWQQNRQKYLSGIAEDERKKLVNLIENIINHPDLKSYFSREYEIINEAGIIIPQGQKFSQKRPDRLMIKNNEVVIMDYKTGQVLPGHERQLNTYASLLQELGFSISRKILVYIQEPEVLVKMF